MKTALRPLVMVTRMIGYGKARYSREARYRREFDRLESLMARVGTRMEQMSPALEALHSMSHFRRELIYMEIHLLAFVHENSCAQKNWRSLRRNLRYANRSAKPLLKLHKVLARAS